MAKKLYNPKDKEPFKISRSKIELFIDCPRCFYLDRRLGIKRPGAMPFTLNSAVDNLLKQEFDVHRAKGEKHPLIEEYGVDAVPAPHDDLNKWRHNFAGVQFSDEKNNFLIFGAIDDLWINSKGEYIVVDYKATSKLGEIESLDDVYKGGASYKRQMEIYQWLLRKNGYKVSDTGYFVYCNGIKDAKAFDKKLEFKVNLIEYKGDDSWIEKTVSEIKKCLNSNKIPASGEDCEFCDYFEARKENG